MAAAIGTLSRLLIILGVVAVSNAIQHPIFSFGDSNSDAGNLLAIDYDSAPGVPYGRTFFNHSTGRHSDGRLIIDFLSESLNNSILSPYLMPFGGKFNNGANFAYGGSSIILGDTCFKLRGQTDLLEGYQYIVMFDTLYRHFHMNENQGAELRRGLYIIDMGQQDLQFAFENANYSYQDAILQVPKIMEELNDIIADTLNSTDGGRKIWVHGTGPLGCLPHNAMKLGEKDYELDPYGCVVAANDLAKFFNNQLKELLRDINHNFTKYGNPASVVFTDIYSIKYDLIANHTKYGFEEPTKYCLQTNPPCPLGSRYIYWDSLHYTDAANAIVASKILGGDYSDPPTKLQDFYSKWET